MCIYVTLKPLNNFYISENSSFSMVAARCARLFAVITCLDSAASQATIGISATSEQLAQWAQPDDMSAHGIHNEGRADHLHELQERWHQSGRTRLHQASWEGDVEAARAHLEGGAPVDQQDTDGITAMHIAVTEGNVKVVQELIKAGADLELRARNWQTALHFAVSSSACLPRELAERKRPTPQVSGEHRRTQQQLLRFEIPDLAKIAALNNNFYDMKVAVKPVPGKGLGVVALEDLPAGKVVAFCLTRIFVKGQKAASGFALERSDGRTFNDIFDGSFRSPGEDGIPYVGAFINEITDGEDQSYNVMASLWHDDVKNNVTLYAFITQSQVAAGDELTWYYGRSYPRDGYRAKYPPRRWQCAPGDNVKVARMLLKGGAAIDAMEGEHGFTALLIAAQMGDVEMAKVLIEEGGAALDATSDTNENAMHVAARSGDHADVIRAMLNRESALHADAVMNDGFTALHFAAFNGHEQVTRALLEGGATVDVRSPEGTNPLGAAASNGFAGIVRLLLEAGAEVDQTDEEAFTALMLACDNGHDDVVGILLEAGAEPNKANDDGMTSLMWASYNGHTNIILRLLKAGARAAVDLTNQEGYTALMYASQTGHSLAVRKLLEAGARWDLRTARGATALTLACRNRHEALCDQFEGWIQFLIEMNAANHPALGSLGELSAPIAAMGGEAPHAIASLIASQGLGVAPTKRPPVNIKLEV